EEAFENQACREGANDGGEAGKIGQPSQQKSESDAEEKLEIFHLKACKAPYDSRRDPQADANGSHEKDDGFCCDSENATDANAAVQNERGDNGQHQQAEDVVNHRGTQNDPGF